MITARILWAMVPDWLRATGAVAVVLIGVYAAGHHMGGKAERQDKAAQDARDYIEGTQDADEALDDVRSRGAAEWLRDTFGGTGGGNP